MSQPQNACSASVTPADNDLLLRQVKIAAPCSVKWETMPGGERVRSCAQCSHKVYNLSAMSGDEAANLIRQAEGRICVRLYRRADGSVMTRDCPTGLRAVRQRVSRAVAVSFASVFSIMGLFSLAERFRAQPALMMGAPATAPQVPSQTPPVSAVMGAPEPIVEMGEAVADPTTHDSPIVMGKIMYRPATPLPMVAPTPDAEKTFLPHESEPSEVRGDPFAPVPKKANTVKTEAPARP